MSKLLEDCDVAADLGGYMSEGSPPDHVFLVQPGRIEVDRLLGVFEAVHGSAFQSASPEHAFELLQSAQSADGALLVQLDRDLMGIVAALLAEAGVTKDKPLRVEMVTRAIANAQEKNAKEAR